MQLKKAIGQNVFWRGMYLASSFAINVLVSRLLNADRSGSVFYIINNLAFLILITSLSLESGTAYYLAKKQITPNKVAVFAILYSTIAAVVCLVLYRVLFASAVGDEIKTSILFLYVVGTMLISFFNGLFASLQNFRLPNIILLAVNLLLMLCLLIFKQQHFLPLQFYLIYFGSFALQGAVLAIAFMVVNKKTAVESYAASNNIFRLVFKFSMMAISANIIYFLLYRVDYWFVNKYCNVADLGNYIQASKLGQIFLTIPSIVGASVFATVAAQKENTATKVLTISRSVFGIAAVLMVLLLTVGKWLFPFLFGNSFNHMYGAFALLAPGTLAICFLYPLTNYFAGIKMIKVNIIGSSIALLVLLICDILFIPAYGIMAAAAISSIGYIVYAIYITVFFCKRNNITFTSIFEIKKPKLNRLPTAKNENIKQ